MSKQRLIDANFLALSIHTAAERLALENGDNIISKTCTTLAEYLESGRIGITVDAVPREEHESLLKRFRQLEAERDAAVEAIEHTCATCKHYYYNSADGYDCQYDGLVGEDGCHNGNTRWEWCGVPKEAKSDV